MSEQSNVPSSEYYRRGFRAFVSYDQWKTRGIKIQEWSLVWNGNFQEYGSAELAFKKWALSSVFIDS